VRIANARSGQSIPYSEAVEIEFDYTVNGELPIGRFGLTVANEEGLPVLSSADTDTMSNLNRPWPLGRFVVRCTIPGSLLRPGRYYLTLSEPRRTGGDIIHENLLAFTINAYSSPSERDGRRGVITPTLHWDHGEA
jgi:hypothetical protein